MQIFQLSHQELHNLTETAPETWADSCHYDEKSDVFSFAVILWRLFGSKLQGKKARKLTVTEEEEEADEELDFLKVKGRLGPVSQQREIIRKVRLQ